MMKTSETPKSEKVLKAIYELEKRRKSGENITREMVVIKAWEMFPSDFSLRGFPQHPSVDLARRIITNLKRSNFVKGGANSYYITEKGIRFIEKKSIKNDKKDVHSNIKKAPRYIELEITRIINSKVYSYFLKGECDFLENDLFDFIGTSVRSFKDTNKSNFLTRYNLIIKEIIPFCIENSQKNKELKNIVKLWDLLENKFRGILENE